MPIHDRLPRHRQRRRRAVVRARGRRQRRRARRHEAQRRRVEHEVRPGRHRRGAQRGGLVRRRTSTTRCAPGAGLCHERAVEVCVKEGPARIRHAPRHRRALRHAPRAAPATDDDLDLHLEGGHSARRVAHAADMTGREVERALLEAVGAARRAFACSRATPRSTSSRSPSTAAPRCAPAPTCSTRRAARSSRSWRARSSSRSGGAGKVYLYTTNPDVATGDGVAMAYPRGRRDREHGVLPVSPDVPLPPAGEALSHHRGDARRGGGPPAARRHAVHEGARSRAATSRRATSSRAPSTSR